MNPAHLHLLVTHLPVLGSLFGLCLLLIALVQRHTGLTRTSLWTFVVAGLAAIPTYLTGRPASTVLVKLMPGMSMDTGDQHAEVAVLALVAVLLLALFSLAGIVVFRKGKNPPAWFLGLALVLALISTATMAWTATLGGRIRHTEIQTPSGLQTAR